METEVGDRGTERRDRGTEEEDRRTERGRMNRERETGMGRQRDRVGGRGTEGGRMEERREGTEEWGHRGTERGDRMAERKGIQELWAVSWACPSWDSRWWTPGSFNQFFWLFFVAPEISFCFLPPKVAR